MWRVFNIVSPQGKKQMEENWKRCVKETGYGWYNDGLRLITGSMFARQYFPEEAKAQVKRSKPWLNVNRS